MANDPFAMRIFVPDGDPEGVRIYRPDNWTGLGIVFPDETWPATCCVDVATQDLRSAASEQQLKIHAHYE
jgi:hypothetical protein